MTDYVDTKKDLDVWNIPKCLGTWVAERVEQRVTERFGPEEMVVLRDLGRYYEMLSFSLPKFAVNEACLIIEAYSGCIIPQWGFLTLGDDIQEAIEYERLDEKWEVDGRELVERLMGLPAASAMAVLDAIERYREVPKAGRTYEEVLGEVGLVKHS